MPGDAGEFKLKPVLTKASWDKQKGVVAKIFKNETGIGKAIDMMKIGHDGVNWARFLGATTTKADLQAEYEGNVKELIKELLDLEDKATKIGRDFKKNPLIPKASSKAVEEIAAAAGLLAAELGKFYTNQLPKLK